MGFDKSSLSNYFKYAFIPYFIIYILAVLLTPSTSSIITMFTYALLILYTYLFHILLHLVPYPFDLHMRYHHAEEFQNSTEELIAFWIEVLVDSGMFVIFYFIKEALSLKFLDNRVIVFIGMMYVSVHMINYSTFHVSPSHCLHHTSEKIVGNYWPDVCDHIFDTNLGDSFENNDHFIINGLCAFLLTKALFKTSS